MDAAGCNHRALRRPAQTQAGWPLKTRPPEQDGCSGGSEHAQVAMQTSHASAPLSICFSPIQSRFLYTHLIPRFDHDLSSSHYRYRCCHWSFVSNSLLPIFTLPEQHVSEYSKGADVLSFALEPAETYVWGQPSLGTCLSNCVSSSALKELPCSALAPSLEPCFSRPERPANRCPPSRWAPHSPTASPVPSPGDPTSLEELGDEEPPGRSHTCDAGSHG